MLKLRLARERADKYPVIKGTIGLIHLPQPVDDISTIHTLELPWLDNRRGVSCIPTGIYKVRPHISAAYPGADNNHPGAYELLKVPGRTAILIHVGNFLHDIKGCIALGLSTRRAAMGMGDEWTVEKSGEAMRALRATVWDAEWELEIV